MKANLFRKNNEIELDKNVAKQLREQQKAQKKAAKEAENVKKKAAKEAAKAEKQAQRELKKAGQEMENQAQEAEAEVAAAEETAETVVLEEVVETTEEIISQGVEGTTEESTIPEDVAEILAEIDEAASAEEVVVEQETAAKKDKKVKKPKLPKVEMINPFNKIRINISHKLLGLCLLPMIIICIGMTIFSSQALRNGMEQEIEKALRIVATSVKETYTNLYEGDYVTSQSGKVTKGDTTISGDTQLIDGLKDETGFEVSFLFGNMRLITTVRNVNGSKANGTSISSDIYTRIENNEVVTVDNYIISGNEYYAYYQPLVNSDGSIIGAIEVAMESSEVNSLIRSQVVKIVLFAVCFVVVAAVFVLLLSRTMTTTMGAIHKFLSKLVNGELDAATEVKHENRSDELGDIYRIAIKLRETLLKIVSDIKNSSDNLLKSANQLNTMAEDSMVTMDGVVASVDEISQGAMTQAESSATANDNIAKISEQIDHITEEVEHLTAYAERMNEDEKASERIIEELNETSEETKVSVDKVAEQINIMHQSIQGIQNAVEMIQTIADETDLLSLNARIEAARAGESGKGFAVVAEQICKLADQSSKSASEIEKIIAGFMETSQKMVAIMNEVRMNMNHQQMKLEETKEKYHDVSRGVENSLTNIGSIKEEMVVLSESRNVVKDVVEDLAAISEENAASSQSTKEAAQGMTDTMEKLQQASEQLLQLSDTLKEGLVIFKI